MAFIRFQNIKRDESGKIVSGSASIIDVLYEKSTKHHSKQVTRERLGKVVSMDPSRRSGVFISPVRGLVRYDADSDTFERVLKDDEGFQGIGIEPDSEEHPLFGDAYLVFSFLEKSGIVRIVRNMFVDDSEYERALVHLVYGIARNGSNEACDVFTDNTFAAFLAPDVPLRSLRSDTAYFTAMGHSGMKKEFFKQFVELMRSKDPRFGRCCYVDTTPLPNDAEDNPFNALCSHGVEATSVQMRLAIIQDLYTGFPVWFDIIPGNVLDVSTIMDEIDEVKHCLDIDIMDLVLDAGYASSSLLNAFNLDGQGSGEKDFRSLVVRMPNKKGYPFMDLFNGSRKLFDNGKYAFVRERHTYFGIKREVDVFGHKEYAYVYLDRENASRGFKNWMDKHEDEFQGMTDKKKTFRLFEDGFFVLISNKDSSPRGILDDYFGRQWIESLFKTSKRYLKLLPISKWTDRTVRGKVLSDIIDTIAYLSMRSMLNEKTSYTMADALSHPRSLTSYVANGDICVNYPKKQVKEIYQAVGVEIPVSINLDRFRKDRLLLRVH